MWRWLRSLFISPAAQVSPEWLADQERLTARVEFHGVRWSFPVHKLKNESPRWNARRLRRSA